MNNQEENPRGHAPLLLIIAITIIACLSAVPWESCTNGKIKDFNLVSDLVRSDSTASDSADLTAEINWEEEPIISDTTSGTNTGNPSDTITEPLPPKPNRIGDLTVIEDYSQAQNGLDNIKASLASGRTARIAVVGDSYIEGDIMTQDLRDLLQEAYGGSGVGYMNMHSDFPGFRQSVKQSGKGWKCYTATKRGKEQYMGLSEQYAQPQGNATATYKGTKRLAHTGKWDKSQFLFIAPNATTIRTRAVNEWTDHKVQGSPDVQAITLDSVTTEFSVAATDPSLVALGVWLDGTGRGIAVDCMSSRGIPGYSLAKIPSELCQQMSRWINYDLIILEFGINVLSPKQKDYSRFTSNMIGVIAHLRECYPSSRILVMGIGDRGEKRDGSVKSMSTIPAMIEAQRTAARKAGVLFWDTQNAMGGENAIVNWSKTGLANKDYVHLTHEGGAELASQLSRALRQMIDK